MNPKAIILGTMILACAVAVVVLGGALHAVTRGELPERSCVYIPQPAKEDQRACVRRNVSLSQDDCMRELGYHKRCQ